MTISEAILELLRDTPNVTYTPQLLRYEALKRDIYVTYENAKKILQRFARRGIVQRVGRGEYIFSGQRDTMSQLKGQKGTNLRGMSHPNGASIELRKFRNKCDKGTCHNHKGYPSLFRRMVAVLTSEKMRNRTIYTHDFIRGPYLKNLGNPATKRRYITRLVNHGVLIRIGRGRYKVNVDRARELTEGTPLGSRSDRPLNQRDNLITVSHHFRIKKPVPLTEEEFSKISKYIWTKDPVKDYVNGVYLEATPTGDRDRSHGVKIETLGAIFHITYSYKKNLAKVMIYPKGREHWTWYAQQLFGEEFAKRAIKIGISSHFGLNLDEVQKVLFEGEEIKVTINKSDFGASGDLEFEGVTEEGAELVKKLLETKLEAVGEVVDVFESVKRMISEIEARLYRIENRSDIEDLKNRLVILENKVGKIWEHVALHTRYINLALKSMEPGNVEGYA